MVRRILRSLLAGRVDLEDILAMEGRRAGLGILGTVVGLKDVVAGFERLREVEGGLWP
jgi:hypothetical protein